MRLFVPFKIFTGVRNIYSKMTFIDFLQEKHVLMTVIGLIMAREAKYLTDSFLDDIVMPVINRDGDCDGEEDIDTLKKYKLKLGGATINIGNFAITIIKNFIVLLIVYVLYSFAT